MARARPLRIADHIVFVALIGILGTLIGVHRYIFGFVNQLETLPPIFRALDPAFAISDYFVNDEVIFGARHYYVLGIVFLANVMPLPWVCFVVACLSHTATVAVTYVAARRLFKGDTLAAMLACTLVMAIESIQLGGVTGLKTYFTGPHTVAVPFALAAVAFGIFGRPYAACIVAGLGALMHPLVGTESGAIALATSGIAALFDIGGQSQPSLRERLRATAPTLGACALFGFFTLVAWVLPSRGSNADGATIFELIRVRGPHHYFPSVFGFSNYVYFACFLVSFGISWRWWYRSTGTDRRIALRFLLPIGLILVLLVGGYLFVEVFPVPLWATAQVYRLIFILKWQGYLLFGLTIGRLLCPRNVADNRIDVLSQRSDGLATTNSDSSLLPLRKAPGALALGILMLFANGPMHPCFLLIGHLAAGIRSYVHARWGRRTTAVGASAILLLSLVGLVCVGEFAEWYMLILFSLMSSWFILMPNKWYRSALPMAGFALIVCMFVVDRHHPIPYLTEFLAKRQPVLTLADGGAPEDAVAEFALKHTPEDAVILTPPYLGRVRLVARRAIVVDYKLIGFSQASLNEWVRRWRDCYGTGEDMPSGEYRDIRESRIWRIAEKYGASYAVLFKETPCSFPIEYLDAKFKLVKIPLHGALKN